MIEKLTVANVTTTSTVSQQPPLRWLDGKLQYLATVWDGCAARTEWVDVPVMRSDGDKDDG